MRKNIYAIILILLSAIWFLSCTNTFDNKVAEEKIIPKQTGNTSGNLTQHGMLAQEGEWIYYSNVEDSGSIYRKKTDNSVTEKLNDADSDYLNLCGEWIYYRRPDDHGVYKMKTDGTCEEKIYEGIINHLTYSDGYLYFSEDSTIKKIDVNGNYKNLIFNGIGEFVYVLDGWVYFSNLYEECLERRRIDGSDSQILVEEDIGIFVIEEDWIYFVDEEYQLCKIKTDGTEKQVISHEAPDCMHIHNDYIYYSDYDEIWRMKLDGTKKEKFFECLETLLDFSITDDALYYCYRNGEKYNEEIHMKLELLDIFAK